MIAFLVETFILREGIKKRFFLGDLSQMCLTTHPPQGFCEIWENERWNLGRKSRFSGWFGGVLRALDLVWESATPPTHIWERTPKIFFFFTPSLRAEWQDWIPPPSGRIGSVAFAVLLSSNMQKGEKMHILDDNLYFHICYSLADCFFGCLLKVIYTFAWSQS